MNKEEKQNQKLIQKKREQVHKEMLFSAYQARKETKVAPKDVCISLKNINKIYPNHVQAVYDFSLDIKEKEFIVFVGPSGCGKSTTLRMIAGLEDITYGDLFIDGKYANELLPKERDIAMVFQNYALYPNMTVFDNIAFSLKLKHLPKEEIRKRVLHAAELLDITKYLDRKPAALSGGQRQRVALGRAIVRDVRVFLMDEPLSNLDAKLRVQMRSEIVNLHRNIGSTTIYVTHDQTEAMTMASRIVVMKDGYVQQIGTPREIYNQPANLFVATFIGAPAMNVMNVNFKKNKIILPNGFEIKLSKEQVNKLSSFNVQMIETYKNKIADLEQKIKDREYELTYPSYEKDMELYSRKKIKLNNEVIALRKDIEDAKASNQDQAVVSELEELLKSKETAYQTYITSGLDEVTNKEYKKISDEKLDQKKNSDPSYLLLIKDKNECERLLNHYESIEQAKEYEMLFGIRPENLLDQKLSTLCKNPSEPLELTIDIAELLGDQYYLHTSIGNANIIAKSTTDDNIQSGDKVKVYIDLDKFHLFDKESTNRII